MLQRTQFEDNGEIDQLKENLVSKEKEIGVLKEELEGFARRMQKLKSSC